MKRHPLLILRRRLTGWRWPALLITLACGALWWFAPDIFPPGAVDFASTAVLAGVFTGLLLFVYTLAAPALAYVECRPQYLLVSTPLYRVAIAYRRIRTVRPVKFAPAVTGLQGELVGPYLGQTGLFIDLNGYPLAENWLRFWLGWFMFTPQATGLLFIVPDWMALSRDLETQQVAWKTRRSARG